jgi:deazaflavin-dependent oxidoreductase (nitroreductase family)
MTDETPDHIELATNPPPDLAAEEYCYLTTTGRVTGRPHEIEIWFGMRGSTLYFLSGGGEGSDWVKNLRANPAASVRIGEQTFQGLARGLEDGQEQALVRRLLAAKYQEWHEGQRLSSWARTALPVAIELAVG